MCCSLGKGFREAGYALLCFTIHQLPPYRAFFNNRLMRLASYPPLSRGDSTPCRCNQTEGSRLRGSQRGYPLLSYCVGYLLPVTSDAGFRYFIWAIVARTFVTTDGGSGA